MRRLFILARRKWSRASSIRAPAADDGCQLLQQLTRYRDEHGRQSIHGTLLAEFEPGQRHATLYVSFCPPFEQLPSMEVEVTDESRADVKLIQLLHNGAEFEVRLERPTHANRAVTIEFLAQQAASTE